MSRTIEDVLALAGNRPVFEALVSILKAGKAIAFVGAGASAPMYPLWGRFIELLADHAVAEGKAEDKDAKRWKADSTSNPQQRVNVILRKLGEPLYRNFLRATFGPRKGPDGRRYTAIHAALLHVPFRGYVTTNYDPALEMVGEFLRDLGDANAVPPHVAILGLPVEKDGRLPDTEAVREQRENLEADYHVRALFYIAGLAAVAPPLAPAATPASHLPAKWIHETSNDEKFTGRNDEIARLDRWVRDAAVRVLGVSAVGGTGKTALIGHWLKNTASWRCRPFAGLFAWSFYQDRDNEEFLEAFLEWARETFRIPEAKDDTKLVAAALAALRAHPLVLVLD